MDETLDELVNVNVSTSMNMNKRIEGEQRASLFWAVVAQWLTVGIIRQYRAHNRTLLHG